MEQKNTSTILDNMEDTNYPSYGLPTIDLSVATANYLFYTQKFKE